MTTAEAYRLVERSYLDSNSGRDSGTGLDRVFCMEGDSAGGLPSTLSSLVTTADRVVERGSDLDGLGMDSGSGLDGGTAGSLSTPLTSLVNNGGSLVASSSTQEGSKSFTCPFCGMQGIAAPSKLRLHIERMHSSPINCNCRQELLLHVPKS